MAEIGIGYGATALQILSLLGEKDVYYGFDYQDVVDKFKFDLQSDKFNFKCQINVLGNSRKTYDSYNWNLSELIFIMRAKKINGLFDVVYLDGGHTLLISGLAVCMLKYLIRKGGFLILDDLHWTIAGNKVLKEAGATLYTEQQMDDMQILRVQEIFLRNDPCFEKLSDERAYRSVFRKVADYPSR